MNEQPDDLDAWEQAEAARWHACLRQRQVADPEERAGLVAHLLDRYGRVSWEPHTAGQIAVAVDQEARASLDPAVRSSGLLVVAALRARFGTSPNWPRALLGAP